MSNFKNFKDFVAAKNCSESLNEAKFDKQDIITIISALDNNQLNQVEKLLQSLIPVYSDVIELSIGSNFNQNLKKVFDNVEEVKKEVAKAKDKSDILKICEKHLKKGFTISKYEGPKSNDAPAGSSVDVYGEDKRLYTLEFYKFLYALKFKK